MHGPINIRLTSKSIKCLLHVMETVFSKIKVSKLQLQFNRTYFIKGFIEPNASTLDLDFLRPLLFYITQNSALSKALIFHENNQTNFHD